MDARQTATTDQALALLRDLVAEAREHLSVCDEPEARMCIGQDAMLALRRHPGWHMTLLCTALIELAEQEVKHHGRPRNQR